MPLRALILGGTGEARELAQILTGERGFDIVSSLAGRLRHPQLPDGEVRVGGFGGVSGLREWLSDNAIDAMIVATHPFAARISTNAVRAAAELDLPVVVLRRAPWKPESGDRWISVESLSAAATALPGLGRRVFLTIGRQGVAEFAELSSHWFLIRAIDPPTGSVPAEHELLLERGPFTIEHESHLIASRRIDVLVTKNSGGEQTSAKLVAARRAGLSVVMIDRPPLPAGAETVESVLEAADWLRGIARWSDHQ